MRKISYLLIAILLSSFVNLLPVNSQPNGCININGIKTPELIAQFNTWLNEPDGLNARFLDGTESSQERGERLFYDLFLNNNRICLSDLNQEMIDSIIEVIRSYDSAPDHNYLVNGFTVSRLQINNAFKAIRNPVIMSNSNNIFAEAVQFSRPNFDRIQGGYLNTTGISCFLDLLCHLEIDEVILDNSDFIETPVTPTNQTANYNISATQDPLIDTNHFMNYTFGKDLTGGKQIDTKIRIAHRSTFDLCTAFPVTVSSHVDIGLFFIQNNFDIPSADIANIIDYSDLCFRIENNAVGGGGGRFARNSWFQFGVPDVENISPQIANATLWGLFNSSDTQYSILSVEGRDKTFQDQQLRLNLTVTDLNGRNNITEVHALFNATDSDQFLMSFYNDSGTFIFNTTTPLIVENLEGLNTEITDGWNITFVFSLSDQLGHGYIWLSNANVTDNNTDATLVRERWFSFIREPGATVSLGTSELFPLAPLMNLFFIIGGFLLVFNAKGRLEFQASGMFFFLASLLFIISPIYAILDSNNVLSYEILNYPDSIRNNFVLINFVFIGLGLTSVIINNKGRLGFR